MPLPIAITLVYVAVNLAMLVWLERNRAAGGTPGTGLIVASSVLRFGPPLLGLLYLVTIAGDWLFFLFVLAFFGAAFWMMDGVLTQASPSRGSDTMRSGWDDRSRGSSSSTDRETS